MNKQCPRCSKTFHCDSDSDCWCESANIHKKEMILIMKNFDDCLCPECLAVFEEK